MRFKKSLFKKCNIIFIVIFFLACRVFSQNCSIVKLPRRITSYDNLGLIRKEYEGLKIDTSYVCNMMLIKLSSKSAGKYCFKLSVDSSLKFILKVLTQDSVIYYQTREVSNEYRKIFSNAISSDGFLQSSCKNSIDLHSPEILIVCNNAPGNWTEYVSDDGRMASALKENARYAGLQQIYEFVIHEIAKAGF